jgi:predicted SAM-dependent methyltransferase
MGLVSRIQNKLGRYEKKFRHLRARAHLKTLVAQQSTLKIVIGASGICEPGWIPTEIYTLDLLKLSDWNTYFNPNTIDAMMAEHVWEHLSLESGMTAVRNCATYLKSGAYLRLAVPDGLHPDPAYINYVKPGGTGAGADDHKVLYTYRTLTDLLEKAGLQVRLLEYFDENHEFHATNWNPAEGKIERSKRFDSRNSDGVLRYTSLIADAVKV